MIAKRRGSSMFDIVGIEEDMKLAPRIQVSFVSNRLCSKSGE